MQDFGFDQLRVVNEYSPAFEAAQREATSAVGAQAVLRDARRYDTLPDAIADCSVVVGTTAIGERNLDGVVLPLRDGAPRLFEALEAALGAEERRNPDLDIETANVDSRVGLLFGSEKSGLTKEQLSHCSLLLTIPLFAPEGRHLSMNLGQSVAVCLYELTRDGFEDARVLPVVQEPLAVSADRERLLALLLEAMQRSDYARRFPANARIEIVRQLVNRLGSTRNEAATWTGLLRLIVRHLPEGEHGVVSPEANASSGRSSL